MQIYEMAMGDVNGNFTTVLERAFVNLKDNRLPPVGFSTSHYAYDTVKIVGDALSDADFNKVNGAQGSGKDKLHYHIPLHGASGNFEIAAAVYYQTLPPRFLQEMFSYNGQFIDSFKQMYQGANKQPVLIAHTALDTTYTVSGVAPAKAPSGVKVFPMPSTDGRVVVEGNGHPLTRIEIWDAAGRKVKDITPEGSRTAVQLQLPDAAGVYYMNIESGRNSWVKKVIRD
ncbi:MAG: T9SS type A sorting domain-containing protein [Bacteroidetes bacterium]|nr:T9SS type A sorting domain-containing protein [Bacteroidota bacterium]